MGSPFFVDVCQQFALLVYQKGGLPKPISTTFRITPIPGNYCLAMTMRMMMV